MSEPVRVTVGREVFKVYENGEVLKVTGQSLVWNTDRHLKVGKIPPSTPTNQLEKVIRDKFL